MSNRGWKWHPNGSSEPLFCPNNDIKLIRNQILEGVVHFVAAPSLKKKRKPQQQSKEGGNSEEIDFKVHFPDKVYWCKTGYFPPWPCRV